MIICATCRVEMRCLKTGVGADFGGGHIYAGDKFGCPRCGAQALQTNATPHYDPEHKAHDEYLEIDQNPKVVTLKERADSPLIDPATGKLKTGDAMFEAVKGIAYGHLPHKVAEGVLL